MGAPSAEIDVERVKQCGRVDLRSGARVRLYPYRYPSSLASTPTRTATPLLGLYPYPYRHPSSLALALILKPAPNP